MTHRRLSHNTRKSPALTGGDEHWSTRGVCAQADPETFFPEKGGAAAITAATAKRLCNGDPARDIEACPVRTQCLAEALKNDERFGVFGGLTREERDALVRSGR